MTVTIKKKARKKGAECDFKWKFIDINVAAGAAHSGLFDEKGLLTLVEISAA